MIELANDRMLEWKEVIHKAEMMLRKKKWMRKISCDTQNRIMLSPQFHRTFRMEWKKQKNMIALVRVFVSFFWRARIKEIKYILFGLFWMKNSRWFMILWNAAVGANGAHTTVVSSTRKVYDSLLRLFDNQFCGSHFFTIFCFPIFDDLADFHRHKHMNYDK